MSGVPQERTVGVDELIELNADLLTVRVGAPLPPGSRVRLDLAAIGEPSAPPLTGKVVGLERGDPGQYRLRVRLSNLARKDREALQDLLLTPPDDGG